MAEIVREIDRAMARLTGGILASGTFGLCVSVLSLRLLHPRIQLGKYARWAVYATSASVFGAVGGRLYKNYAMTPAEHFLLQLGIDPRYESARSKTLNRPPNP